ncbi:MAG: hypothetical protein Q4C70_11545 [Planctomycetia bacterium]|nr:hypothetical protein [Planctomycetia bacterium]
MNLTSKIREVWSKSVGFCTLIPLDSITTGQSISSCVPYGIIHETDVQAASYTNQGPRARYWKAKLELHLPSLAAANTILEEAPDLFGYNNQFYVESSTCDCLELDHWKIMLNLYHWEYITE